MAGIVTENTECIHCEIPKNLIFFHLRNFGTLTVKPNSFHWFYKTQSNNSKNLFVKHIQNSVINRPHILKTQKFYTISQKKTHFFTHFFTDAKFWKHIKTKCNVFITHILSPLHLYFDSQWSQNIFKFKLQRIQFKSSRCIYIYI